MRASTVTHHTPLTRAASLLATGMLAVGILATPVAAANSRDFSVTVSTPTPVSAGGVTKFDILVDSDDNQTVANVKLSVPASGGTLPAGTAITTVFGRDAAMCSAPTASGLSCDFGNISAFGDRRISVLASLASSVAGGTVLTFSASAETNNENGSNRQVVAGSASVTAIAFSANGLTTFNLGGTASTSALGTTGAGNLQTALNLLGNNGGNGNAIGIVETTSATQPTYCVALNLICQPDSVTVTVNAGAAVVPYLETTLVAKVPKKFNLNKAFVIHVLDNGNVESGFPIFKSNAATTCAGHPNLVPCADFSLSGDILTIVVHTTGNGKYNY